MAEQDWLLTKEERSKINDEMPSTAEYGEVFAAIAQAQLTKAEPLIRQDERVKVLKEVGEWLDRHSFDIKSGFPSSWIIGMNILKRGEMPEGEKHG